ncbi:MAG TPA: hypothetical protein DD670_12855 [Planctomycetaceae bacterium]|nr:hypothetical protein [Planctomycetaceae bacterium]
MQDKLAFVGDLILGDQPLLCGMGVYSKHKDTYREVFEGFAQWLIGQQCHLAVANFEAVLFPKIKRIGPDCSAMKTTPHVIESLQDARIRAVSLANNHSMEYGSNVYTYTRKSLEDNGIDTFGHADKPCLYTRCGRMTIGVFGFSTIPAMYGYKPDYYYVPASDYRAHDELAKRLGEARKEVDYLVAYPHWGTEFVSTPSPSQDSLAERLVACGVDLIVGSHPHVIQSVEQVGNTTVYFSVGNLVTDYPQDRIRRNLCVLIRCSNETIESEGHVFTYDSRFRIQYLSRFTIEQANRPPTSREEHAFAALKARQKVRREMVHHLLLHLPSLIRHWRIPMWMLRRLTFLVRHRKRIKENPDAVYAGPSH